MNLYAILRRAGWRSGEALDAGSARSSRVGDEAMPDDVRWIRSYVLEEGNGAVGTVCIYEATSPEAIRKHAALAELPVDKIIAVTHSWSSARIRPQPGERRGDAPDFIEFIREIPLFATLPDSAVDADRRARARSGTSRRATGCSARGTRARGCTCCGPAASTSCARPATRRS